MRAQHESTLYSPMLIKLPLASYAVTMNYFEVLDETCIDTEHVNDCHEICFCLESKVTVSAGGHTHVLMPGDFLFIIPGTPHNVVYEPDKEKKYFIMDIDLPYIDEYDEKNRPLVTRVNQLSRSVLVAKGACPVAGMSAILDKMEKELQEKNIGWLFLFRGYCLEVLFYCLREVIEPVIESPKEAQSLNQAIEITKYIQNNYSQKISLQDIADALHMSPRHTQRIFSDYFGISYARMLNLYRMNYAKNYLAGTGLSINEVAELVGLSSSQSLNRLFREHERMTANEYRAMKKGVSNGRSETISHF